MANAAGDRWIARERCARVHACNTEVWHVPDDLCKTLSTQSQITDDAKTTGMGKLNLDQLQAGMVLAADVVDRNHRVLLKAGIALTEKHLTVLRQWGITEADIQGVTREELNAQESVELDQDLLAHAETSYRELFRHADMQHPFNQELMRLNVLRTVQRTMRGLES